MPPKSTLTQRDVEVLAAAFQCQKTTVLQHKSHCQLLSPHLSHPNLVLETDRLTTTPFTQIDWDKLAVKVGYKNAQSARACFQETKKRMRAMNDNADDENAQTPLFPSDSSSATLAGSSPIQNTDDGETTLPPKKKSKARGTKAKKPVISTPETEEDVHNAKAIAAGRARYAADKLAAEVKKEEVDDEDEEPVGMNIDSGEDEGLTAYELVKNEVFGEGVEI
ncbi:unnamed protein product [Aureobasidium uvarum]|uniref:Uncharacterized protein n=1 Tax=Aureobasidium uvarum TaxID=2773716 RepID=A0A9N8PTP3_9PEZI|nr:unnamed protein product [Aureobasidium uvarum]